MNTCAEFCLVVLGRAAGLPNLRSELDENSYDCVICADGGQLIAKQLELNVDIYIGDFDSSLPPSGRVKHADLDGNLVEDSLGAEGSLPEVIVLPAEKNVTDSQAAIGLAVNRGYRRIEVLGGLDGRLDHTLGNLSVLAKYVDVPVMIWLRDGYNLVRLVGAGTHRIERGKYKYLGLIPYAGSAHGISLRGVKYEVDDFSLEPDTTRGVSNEILGRYAEVSLKKGRLLIIQSSDVN